jgi:flagellar motility protein MotE (MotC chaperone)
MMSRVWKARKMIAATALPAGAAGLLGVMMLGPAAADNHGKPGWGAKLESEAEFAYRSVYQRSLAAGANRPSSRPGNAAPAKIAAEPRGAAPKAGQSHPDLPVRNPLALANQPPAEPNDKAPAGADAPVADPQTVASTETQHQAEAEDSPSSPAAADPWLEPVFARAAGRDDALVTGVLGGEDGGEVRDRTPRDRGDQYCSNIANAATDARFVWQRQMLRETEEQLKKRIDELQLQIADYQKWLARREEFSKKAQGAVTDIYSKMAPDAAAQQLTVLDEETAAAVIAQLNPRVASAVMAEMEAKRAARLTAIISAASKGPKGKPPASPRDRGT